MATTLKSTQMDVGILPAQICSVATTSKFTGTIAASGTVTLTLPAGVDPTLLVADVAILDTQSLPTAPTYNWWVPGDIAITVAKNATQIKLINETTGPIQYTVVLR